MINNQISNRASRPHCYQV